MRIGVAVSGGGHRATAWALGSLAALVEVGLNAEVVSVSSVSGGSIANGAVAAAGDFRALREPERFAAAVGPTLRVLATDGLFFPGKATRRYLITTLGAAGLAAMGAVGLLAGLIAAGRERPPVAFAIAGAAVGAGIGWVLAGPVRLPRAPVVMGCAATTALLAWGAAALTGTLHGAGVVVAIAAIAIVWLGLGWAAIVLFSGRGRAVEQALAQGLFAHPTESRPLTLADVASTVNHVVCATDLESGDQFYLAPRFLYGFREGISTTAPNTVTLAAAVQASAALPGAFPPSVIPTGAFTRTPSITKPAKPPQRVVVNDGGVYDNRADQWEAGLEKRLQRCEPLRAVQDPAEVLVIANASAGWTWKPFNAKGRIGRELTGLLRDQRVQYDVSTARRRNHLLREFQHNQATGSGPGGVIVMIDRTPTVLAEPFTAGQDDIGTRARDAVAFIDAQHPGPDWDAMATRNADVPTTLGPIGTETTLDLMEHAFTSTVVGLYVLHGIGSLRPFPRDRYAAVLMTNP
jgi:hypothetical protein